MSRVATLVMAMLAALAFVIGGPARAAAQEPETLEFPVVVEQCHVTPARERTDSAFDRLFVAEPLVRSPFFGDSVRQEPAEKPPQPAHTGLAALVYTTGADFKAFPRRRSTWVILGIGAGAAALAHPPDDTVNAHLVGSRAVGRFFAPGKWIGSAYVQLGAATGLYVIGRYVLPPAEGEPKTNKVSHLGFDLVRSLIVSQALTQGIKLTVRRDRPNEECCAFPSGHASATFAMASVLERHLGYRGAWPTFLIATYVATSRLHDNVHFLSDVLFGSALGIASGWTVVGRHGREDYALMPVPTRGGIAVAFVWTSDGQRSPAELR